MPVVKVSARIVSWPQVCVCCLEPAECNATITATRTAGVEVVRTTSKTWTVPYCRLCLEHQDTYRNLEATRRRLVRGFLWAALAAFLAASAVFAVWRWPPEDHITGGLAIPVAFACLAWLVVLVPPIALRQRKAGRLSAWLDRQVSPACACRGPAAAYRGWRDSVHTFDFVGEEYARLFENENARKLVY